mmetsp:Transcript_8608/g.13654  ORF Transcript_8608/g.13654 Transcript_8608/m.13654 type:complete len:84 (+) Transcript_8608:323-574(+)
MKHGCDLARAGSCAFIATVVVAGTVVTALAGCADASYTAVHLSRVRCKGKVGKGRKNFKECGWRLVSRASAVAFRTVDSGFKL